MTWREAFLKQAYSDYLIYRLLAKSPLCHRLHYLQMATEKLAKAYLCQADGSRPAKLDHFFLSKLLRHLKGRRDVRHSLGYGNNYHAFASYVDSLIPTVGKMERLVPTKQDLSRPNPEYPWETPTDVVCPRDYGYPEIAPFELVRFDTLICNLFRVMGTPLI